MPLILNKKVIILGPLFLEMATQKPNGHPMHLGHLVAQKSFQGKNKRKKKLVNKEGPV
jgi:hypothetical protein